MPLNRTVLPPLKNKRRPRFAYIPFGGGPRLCIGNHFALTEARLILAMVAQRFRLELLPGAQMCAPTRWSPSAPAAACP